MGLHPTYTIGHSGAQISLTAICHGKGMEAYRRQKTQEAYLNAYYATLRKLMPNHPALTEEDA